MLSLSFSFRRLLICMTTFFTLGLAGCESIPELYDDPEKGFKPYLVTSKHIWDLDNVPKPLPNNPCQYGGPHTNQGHSLCNQLHHINENKRNIENAIYSNKTDAWGIGRLSVAVLSASAIAANSHVSVLKGLGILTASLIGYESYFSPPNSNDVKELAVNKLSCLDQAARGLLWHDNWYLEMRQLRRVLHSAMSELAGIAATTTDPSLKNEADNIMVEAENALNLVNKAINTYDQMAPRLNQQRIAINTKMIKDIKSSRPEISAIVGDIVNAQQIKQQSMMETDQQIENISKAAEISHETEVASQNDTLDVVKVLISNNTAGLVQTLSTELTETNKDNDFYLLQGLFVIKATMRKITNITPIYLQAKISADACINTPNT